jgi:hypothetical protein
MLRPVSLNHIFQLEGGAEPVSLQFSLSDREADFVNEVGVFLVDDDLGTIGSITPGTPEYLFAALSRGNVIFSALSNGVFPNLDSRRLFSFSDILPYQIKDYGRGFPNSRLRVAAS